MQSVTPTSLKHTLQPNKWITRNKQEMGIALCYKYVMRVQSDEGFAKKEAKNINYLMLGCVGLF
jgi:hypothetical protein